MDHLHGLFLFGEVQLHMVLGPLLEHEEIALMRQRLPDFLGNKGHEGMQQLENIGQNTAQHLLRVDLGRLVVALEAGLGQLDIPVAVVVPDEIVYLLGSHAQLVFVHILGDLGDDGVELGQNPLVLQLQPLGQLARVDGQVHHQEAAGVPNLVGKVAHGLAPLGVEAHVVSRAVAGD